MASFTPCPDSDSAFPGWGFLQASSHGWVFLEHLHSALGAVELCVGKQEIIWVAAQRVPLQPAECALYLLTEAPFTTHHP